MERLQAKSEESLKRSFAMNIKYEPDIIHRKGTVEKRYKILFIIIFILSFCFLLLFLHKRFPILLNSDDSSDLILGKLLSEKNRILSNDWFYSTELRVLNIQIVYSLFFRIINNWQLVRLISILSMCLIMLAACYFLFTHIDLKDYFFAAAVILVLPFSTEYFQFVLKGAYYYPHITISFISIGLIELQINLNRKRRIVILVLLSLLSFLAGLGGPRQIIVTYIPTVTSSIIFFIEESGILYTKKQNNIIKGVKKIPFDCQAYGIASFIAFICSLVGYYVNSTILQEIYDFKFYDISFSKLDITRFIQVLSGFLKSVGYTEGKVISINVFYNSLSILWIVFTIVAIIYAISHAESVSKTYYRLSVMTASSYVIFIALYIFTDLSYSDRYNIPIIVFSIPCILLFLKTTIVNTNYQYAAILIMVLLIIARSIAFYQILSKTDSNHEIRKIVNLLQKDGYYNGYATFWNANIVTDLSNGAVEVWDWGDFSSDFDCIDQVYEWCQLKSHVYEHPEGKVFWILTEEQNTNFHFTDEVSESHLLYKTPEDVNWDILDEKQKVTRYYVYGFSSYEEMYYLVGTHYFSVERIIKTEENISTEKKRLYPDKYIIIIRGENLTDCEISLSYNSYVRYRNQKVVWERPREIPIDNIDIYDECIISYFTATEILNNFQITLGNSGESDAIISGIQITKDNIYYADFYSSEWLQSGYDHEGVRYLQDGGVSYGPYITLVPGTYIVKCEGEGLDLLSYDATYIEDGNLSTLSTTIHELSNNHIKFEFIVESTQENCEIRFFNNSGATTRIEALHVSRVPD